MQVFGGSGRDLKRSETEGGVLCDHTAMSGMFRRGPEGTTADMRQMGSRGKSLALPEITIKQGGNLSKIMKRVKCQFK